jgi:hypothetical protein
LGVREVILKVFYLFVILIAIAMERNGTQLTTLQKDKNTSGLKIAIKRGGSYCHFSGTLLHFLST